MKPFWRSRRKPKVRKFCGKNREEMNEILNFMCELESKVNLSEEEWDMYDIAIQCVAVVINRMVDNKLIIFDEE